MQRNQSSHRDPFIHPVLDDWGRAYLAQRGITEKQGLAARFASVTKCQITELLDKDKEKAIEDGLAIPYLDESGRLLAWRIRFKENNLNRRYATKKGEEGRPYFLPNIDQARYHSPAEPLIEVESPTKALSLASNLNLVVVALGGVDVGGLLSGVWKEAGILELHQDITRRCVLTGRRVAIAFDASAKTNPSVALALAKRVAAYRAKKAHVHTVLLPLKDSGDDQGPDDYLVKHGPDALKQLIDSAPLGDPLERVRALLQLDSIRERTDALRALQEELPFRAALYHGRNGLLDTIAAEAKAAKVDLSKSTLAELARDFKQRLQDKLKALEPDHKPDERPEIEASTDIDRVVVDSLKALERVEGLYQRGRQLVTILKAAKSPVGIERHPETPTIHPVEPALLEVALSSCARFVKTSTVRGREQKRPVEPPARLATRIAALNGWPNIKSLTGIIEAPVFLQDGSILQEPGYHESTGLLFQPNTNYAKVSESPTPEEIKASLLLIQEPFVDFLFETPAHKSAAIAAIFTGLCRWAFAEGNIPLILIDANTKRAGKSLLADVISMFICGRSMPRMSLAEDDVEMDKRLYSLAREGDSYALIDNISQEMTLGSASLDKALTGRESGYKGRLLGTNTMPKAPWDVVLFATGNNVAVKGDTIERVLPIRLNVELERPEERSEFQHPKILHWVKEKRGVLVSAALTICRAWHVAGRPLHRGKRWGSFDEWGDIVRSILVWAGFADPNDTRAALSEGASSPERELHQALLDGWQELGTGEFSGAGAIAVLRKDADEHSKSMGQVPLGFPRLREAFSLMGIPHGTLPSPERLSKALRPRRKKVLGGRRFESRTDNHSKVLLWRVDRLAGVAGVCGSSSNEAKEKPFSDNKSKENHFHTQLPTEHPQTPATPAEPIKEGSSKPPKFRQGPEGDPAPPTATNGFNAEEMRNSPVYEEEII